jgi:hypothetical protein
MGTDYQPAEVMVATFVALGVMVWTVVLLTMSQLGLHAKAPEITAGDAMPIKVKPVIDMDSPLLKLGGKKVRAKMPEMWAKAPPPRPISERQAHVSTKAGDEIPPDDLEVSDAGEPPDPDAEVAENADPMEDTDAGEVGVGGGSPAGSKEGTETDPLKARAASQYHGRISGFLRSGWGCPAGVKPGCASSASVSISGLTVSSVSFAGCGDAALDSAVRAHMQGKVGQSIPPPPENYPDMAPNNFSVTFVCK